MKEVRTVICNKGEYGLRGLAQIFHDMDLDGSKDLNAYYFKVFFDYENNLLGGYLGFEEFLAGLKSYGIFLSEQVFKKNQQKILFFFF